MTLHTKTSNVIARYKFRAPLLFLQFILSRISLKMKRTLKNSSTNAHLPENKLPLLLPLWLLLQTKKSKRKK